MNVDDLILESYGMELETVLNYLANSVNLDGVRAEEIKKSLGADVPGEIAHAQQLAGRIKQLGGHIPGSRPARRRQHRVAPPPGHRPDAP